MRDIDHLFRDRRRRAQIRAASPAPSRRRGGSRAARDRAEPADPRRRSHCPPPSRRGRRRPRGRRGSRASGAPPASPPKDPGRIPRSYRGRTDHRRAAAHRRTKDEERSRAPGREYPPARAGRNKACATRRSGRWSRSGEFVGCLSCTFIVALPCLEDGWAAGDEVGRRRPKHRTTRPFGLPSRRHYPDQVRWVLLSRSSSERRPSPRRACYPRPRIAASPAIDSPAIDGPAAERCGKNVTDPKIFTGVRPIAMSLTARSVRFSDKFWAIVSCEIRTPPGCRVLLNGV